MLPKFISWLENNKPKSVSHYSSGFNTIENILKENNLFSLRTWTIDVFESEYEKLKSLDSFKERNIRGNNILSATITNYKKFMEDLITKPIIPFNNFGWRWATTGIASYLNKPKSLKVVLDAILINGDEQDNYTIEFKNLLKKLCSNKYKIDTDKIDQITKLSNTNPEKNIIENSANYWFHLDLLEKTGRNAKVSELGKSFLEGEISNDEFILNRIENYKLPNAAYKPINKKEWTDRQLIIFPFKIIENVLFYLKENTDIQHQYITENDLKHIVIPCSVDIEKYSTKLIVEYILDFRLNTSNYQNWPNTFSHYSGDKGERMANEFLYFLEVFNFLDSNNTNTVRSSDKKYFLSDKYISLRYGESKKPLDSKKNIKQIDLETSTFRRDCIESGLNYESKLITRYISSLATKPFVLLSGLSGSGKTKLAQAFAQWICENEKQYCIVPVGADWTNREPLLGYANALEPENYILPENGTLELIINANNNQEKPYFLILDEMNLSHVERYFADFLSVMESKDKFKLHSSKTNLNNNEIEKYNKLIEVPKEIGWPKNLFVVGTVNIDETTYMFSPKVLDRANVIEFRVSETEMVKYFTSAKPLDLKKLIGEDGIPLGAKYAESFVTIAKEKTSDTSKNLTDTLNAFFTSLQKVGAEFGYRTASEIQTLFGQIDKIRPEKTPRESEKIDFAIMQKLLPKLHGSRNKLVPVLSALAILCYDKKPKLERETHIFDKRGTFEEKTIYPISLEKIERMYDNVIANGFTSYAEA